MNKTVGTTAQKIKFSIKDFFSKYDQISKRLRIWLHLLKKSLMENFIFCAVSWPSVNLEPSTTKFFEKPLLHKYVRWARGDRISHLSNRTRTK